MKEFQSIFKNELAEYIEISQGTISKDTLRNTHRVLLSFDSLLAGENAKEISETFINQWIRALHQANAPKTVSDKVSYLRKFLRYLRYEGYCVFMPDCPKTSDSYVPYIFSDDEIQTLLEGADKWADRHPDPKTRQTDMEFCMLLRMLLGCGFRLGEPLAAKVKDVNFHAGTILIRHAKNDKQRAVPMDQTLTQILERYCIAMGIRTDPESYLFPASRNEGAAVSKGTVDCGKPACMYLGNPIPEASASTASAIISPFIPLRGLRRMGVRQTIPCHFYLSILGTMTWTRRRNT